MALILPSTVVPLLMLTVVATNPPAAEKLVLPAIVTVPAVMVAFTALALVLVLLVIDTVPVAPKAALTFTTPELAAAALPPLSLADRLNPVTLVTDALIVMLLPACSVKAFGVTVGATAPDTVMLLLACSVTAAASSWALRLLAPELLIVMSPPPTNV